MSEATQTPEAAATRIFQAQVPANVTDAYIRMLMQVGQLALSAVTKNGMVVLFPQATPGPDGRHQAGIGHVVVPILSHADIQRLVKLAEVIGRSNDAVIRARNSGEAGSMVDAAVTAETSKHNAFQDAVAQAEGRPGGIIIAG
jgi:hypothetical protein